MSGTRTKRRVKLLVGLLASILPVGLVELGLRAAGSYPDPLPVRFVNGLEGEALLGEGVFLPDDRFFWGLRPGAEERYGGDVINANGFRGPSLPLEKTEGVARIALIGDSCTYGTGIEFPCTWGARMAGRLERLGHDVEILNAGVPGHTVFQSARRFDETVAPYLPDLVVLYLPAWNDFTAAVVAPDEELAADPSLSEVRASPLRVVRMLRSWRRPSLDPVGPVIRAGLSGNPVNGLRVGPGAFERILGDLLDSCERIDAQVLVILPALNQGYADTLPVYFASSETYREIMGRTARERGLATLDLAELLPASRHGDLYLDVVHPSYVGSLWLGCHLAETIDREGVLGSPAEGDERVSPPSGGVEVVTSPRRVVSSEDVEFVVEVRAGTEWAGARVKLVPTSTPYPLNALLEDPIPLPAYDRDVLSERIESELGRIFTTLDSSGGVRAEITIPAGMLSGVGVFGFGARLEADGEVLYCRPDWILVDP